MKPVLAVIGVGMIILGLFGLSHSTWLGWLDIIIGVLAVLGSAAKLPQAGRYTGVALGVASLICWIIALASGVAGWLAWLTFVGGVAFILSSPMVVGPTLPSGRSTGGTFPPSR